MMAAFHTHRSSHKNETGLRESSEMSQLDFFPERGIAFVINATSKAAEPAFRLMQDTIKLVIESYGLEDVKFHVITRGEDKIHFDSKFSDLTALQERVEELECGSEGIPALHKDLEKALSAFQRKSLSGYKKVIIMHYKTRETAFHSIFKHREES